MNLGRRDVLIGLSASFVSALGIRSGLAADEPLYAAARREADGGYAAVIFGENCGDVARIALPERGHDVALRPGAQECVAIARRPGRFGVAFSALNAAPPQWFASKPDRHFNGHAAFSPEGRLLYTTENDYEAARGVIGVRDATASYAQIGEFPSYGIDPHDLAVIQGGEVMVVANGGVITHPGSGRAPLNSAAMEPSLVYIDLRDGSLIEKIVLDQNLQKLSIRHLAVAGDGRIAFGCQYEGAPEDLPPLIGFHQLGRAPKLVEAPAGIHESLKNYIGSVAADRAGEIVAASSPRGGLVTFWDAASASYLGSRSLEDVCGVADTPQHRCFLMTTGLGIIEAYDAAGAGKPLRDAASSVNWDNHLLRISG